MKFAHNSTDPEPALKTSETHRARRHRFALWACIVLATLAAPLWCLLPQLNIIGAAQAFAGLAIFLQLLKTTPANAIKLPWGASAAIILLGAAAIILGAANAWRTAILWSLAAISAAATLLAMLMSAGSTGVPPV